MEIYKVLMFGSRNFVNNKAVRREIRLAKQRAERRGCELVIIEGKAPGADQAAGYWGKRADVHVAEVGALWPYRHNGAGPQRNEVMKLLGPDEAVCFHEQPSRLKLKKGSGSADMKRRLDKADIPVKVVSK